MLTYFDLLDFDIFMARLRSYGATIEQNLQPWGEWGGGGGVGDASMTRKLLRAIKITLGQIENARLFLKPVVQTHTFSNPEELANFLLLHYRRQVGRSAEALLIVVVVVVVKLLIVQSSTRARS